MLLGHDAFDVTGHLADLGSQAAQRPEHLGGPLGTAVWVPTANQVETGACSDGHEATKTSQSTRGKRALVFHDRSIATGSLALRGGFLGGLEEVAAEVLESGR